MDVDIESRLGVKLESGGGSWDEVVAFTERILNKNFQTIFDQNLEMRQVQWDDPSVGIVDVQLNSPRIIIPGQEDMLLAKTVYFQIRFASGFISTSTGSAQADVTNWELAIPCDLHSQEPSWNPAPDKNGNFTRRQCTVNGRIYNFPGDYSAQRLFAQLSTAKWNEPNAKFSQVWDKKTQKLMTVEEWQKIGYNAKLWNVLKNTLQSWATDEENAQRSTLNVTFQLPSDNYDSSAPEPTYGESFPEIPSPVTPAYPNSTTAPTFLHQQTYPYISPTKGVEKGENNLKGTGYNALLWCEMVADRKPPETMVIPWTGNFVVPPRSNAGDDGIDGTFALSYTHFLEQHLLPRLFRFNQAVEVPGLTETYSMEDGCYHTSWNYSVGNFQKNSNDEYFKFDRVLPAAGSKDCAKYVFNKEHHTNQNINIWSSGHAAKLIHQSKCTVTVTWNLGGQTVYVHGYTEYEFDQTHAKNSNFASQDVTGRLKYKYYLNWDISLILLSIEGGTMKWDVRTQGRDGRPAGNVVVTQDPTIQENMTTPDNQDANIRKWFTENIERCVKQLPIDLNTELRTSAHFTYPGAGQLDFSAPVINKWGNILATVTHKPLTNMGNFITVHPALKIPQPKLLGIEPKVTTVGAGVAPPYALLDWSVTPAKANALQNKSKFTLTGANTRTPPAPIGFGYVKFKFSSASKGPNMFRNDKINGKTNSLYKPPPSPTPALQSGPASAPQKAHEAKDDPASQPQSKAGGLGRRILDGLKGNPTPAPVEAAKPSDTPASAPQEKPTPASAPQEKPIPAGPIGNTPQPQADEENVGTIKTSASSSDIDINKTPLVQVAFETDDGQVYWQVASEASEGKPGFIIQPGESISYEFEMDTGAANSYQFYVAESWRQPGDLKKRLDGKPFVSDDKLVTLTLKPGN